METVSLLLVRHGERADMVSNHTWNKTKHSSDRPKDPPLTGLGRVQAAQVATEIRQSAPKAQVIYTSPLQRCLQTAAEIAFHLDLPIKVVVSLAKPCKYFRHCLASRTEPLFPDSDQAAQILRDVHPSIRLVGFERDDNLSFQGALEQIGVLAAEEQPRECIPQAIVVGHCEGQKEMAHVAGIIERIKTPYCGITTFQLERAQRSKVKWSLLSRPTLSAEAVARAASGFRGPSVT